MSIIIRVNSHRAGEKLGHLIPEGEHTSLYDVGYRYGGVFHRIPDEYAERARAIKGITMPRDQDHSHYRECIRMGDSR